VLVRQHARNANDNWKHTILGLHYGGVPSVNSLESVYNFLDRPWVVSRPNLLKLESMLLTRKSCYRRDSRAMPL